MMIDDEDRLRVRRDAFWSYCSPLLVVGPDSDAATQQLPSSLHEWSAAALTGGSVLLGRLLPFLAFVNRFVAENGLDHYWLTIRATTPTAEYDRPRWHTDDMFFSTSPPAPPTPRRWSLSWALPSAKQPKEDEEVCSDKQQQQQLDLETG
ncbi:hypothetical protein PG994_005128 [Apiospora phragmitis]|uniref:TauD/TfdA-like domain-containing protein n=1 Tax=Apiospora phragmitis TaxID=2905665 RepID=A0ABR1VSI4_9PEZI